MKTAVQKFGKFLSAMVMPNIGSFIAWGFITALFIEAGWFPNEQLASIQGPMLTYLLPILIAYQGGKMVGGDSNRNSRCYMWYRCQNAHMWYVNGSFCWFGN